MAEPGKPAVCCRPGGQGCQLSGRVQTQGRRETDFWEPESVSQAEEPGRGPASRGNGPCEGMKMGKKLRAWEDQEHRTAAGRGWPRPRGPQCWARSVASAVTGTDPRERGQDGREVDAEAELPLCSQAPHLWAALSAHRALPKSPNVTFSG